MPQKPRVNLTIHQHQKDWIEQNAPESFNLSGFLRDKLDEEIPDQELTDQGNEADS